jgi:hypothetical protein
LGRDLLSRICIWNDILAAISYGSDEEWLHPNKDDPCSKGMPSRIRFHCISFVFMGVGVTAVFLPLAGACNGLETIVSIRISHLKSLRAGW